MKQYILLLSAIVFFTITTNAQLNSGNLFVSGKSDLSFILGSYKWKSGETTSDPYKTFDILFNPTAGYFIMDGLAIGGFMDYSLSRSKHNDNISRYCDLLLGPMARYYLNYDDPGRNPFLEVDLGIGRYKSSYESSGGSTSDDKYFVYGFSGGPGFNCFMNDHIAFEALLKFYFKEEKSKGDEIDYKYMYTGLMLRFGLAVFFSLN